MLRRQIRYTGNDVSAELVSYVFTGQYVSNHTAPHSRRTLIWPRTSYFAQLLSQSVSRSVSQTTMVVLCRFLLRSSRQIYKSSFLTLTNYSGSLKIIYRTDWQFLQQIFWKYHNGDSDHNDVGRL